MSTYEFIAATTLSIGLALGSVWGIILFINELINTQYKKLKNDFKSLCKFDVFSDCAVDFALYLIGEGVELKKVFEYTVKAYPTFKDMMRKEVVKKLKHIR